MALSPSWPGPTGLTSTTGGRRAIAGLIAKNTSGVAREGVFPIHGQPLVTARGDLNVDIGTFQAVAVQFGGPILLPNAGTAQLPSPLVSPVSGTNWYVIYVKQNESASPGTDASTTTVFGAVVSTSSFTAARSTGARLDGSGSGLPTGALELATVQLPTGKASTDASGVTITQTFQYTAAAGGTVWVRNQTELDAWTPTVGNIAYQMDTDTHLRRSLGTWEAIASLWTSAGMASSGSKPTVRYRKINGLVQVVGVGMKTAGGFTMFTLPAGFRPPTQYSFSDPAGPNVVQITPAGVVSYSLNTAVEVNFAIEFLPA